MSLGKRVYSLQDAHSCAFIKKSQICSHDSVGTFPIYPPGTNEPVSQAYFLSSFSAVWADGNSLLSLPVLVLAASFAMTT